MGLAVHQKYFLALDKPKNATVDVPTKRIFKNVFKIP